MKPWRILRGSFRGKVAGAALLTACVALLCAFSLFFVRHWTAERQQFSEDRTVSAEVIAGNLAAAVLFQDADGASETLASARHIPDFSRASVFDAEGRLLASAGETGAQPFKRSGAKRPTSTYEHGHLEIHVPITLDGARVGELAMELGLDHFRRLVSEYVAFTIVLLVLAAGGAGLVAFWLAGKVMQPVERLSKVMGQVRRSGDFAARVRVPADDELGRLTDDFNALLATLQVNDAELRKAMGETIEARDAAQAASKIKSQFLANMSHEIRTPLNGVLGMAQVMARDPLSDAQRERLEVISASGHGLLTLLNDLLDLSKVEAGKLELEDAEFDLATAIDLACGPFAAVAQNKGLVLDLRIADQARGVWRGDVTRVRQIAANLVSNAVKFTRAGKVGVEVSCVEDGLGLRVTDTGVGVPKDKIPMLFEKFSQADASTTREFGGTGLGLAICHELVVLMGGSIACESVEGQGTTFSVRLPLQRLRDADRPAAKEAPVEPSPTGRPLRILAAEDNPTNQRVLAAMLEPAGVDLHMVGNGIEAVEAWHKSAFDLILMDIQMPLMDGVAAMRMIRQYEMLNARGRTPIVALTANAMKHQVDEYLAAGADGHVSKPIEAQALYAALDLALVQTADGQAAA